MLRVRKDGNDGDLRGRVARFGVVLVYIRMGRIAADGSSWLLPNSTLPKGYWMAFSQSTISLRKLSALINGRSPYRAIFCLPKSETTLRRRGCTLCTFMLLSFFYLECLCPFAIRRILKFRWHKTGEK
jgi:hypothetical protein